MKQLAVSLVLLAGVIALAVGGAIYLRTPVQRVNEPAKLPTLAGGQSPWELTYNPAGVVGGESLFADRLAGVAIYTGGEFDVLYAAGDRQVKAFDHCATERGTFEVGGDPTCIGLDSAGNIYVGLDGRVEKYDPAGKPLAKIGERVVRRPTAIAGVGNELLVADADAGAILRFDAGGKLVGRLVPPPSPTTQPTTQAAEAGFRLRPGGVLAMAGAPRNRLIAANPVAHEVIVFSLDGGPTFRWGQFSDSDPAGFTACCNPVALAVLMHDGLPHVVTAEKGVARVKVYDLSGKLLSVIGPDEQLFDPDNSHMAVATDRGGRIFVCDTNRRVIRRFVLAK